MAFVGLGQTSRFWRDITVAPNGDVYACVANGDIYKQTGGTGSFVATGQTSRLWVGIAAASNGDIYATAYGGDIYIQASGGSTFTALSQGTRNWNCISVAPNGDVYVSVYGGDIYVRISGVGDFVALGQTSRQWFGVAVAPNGDAYCCVYSGDIYRRAGGSGNFTALSQTTRNWTGMTADSDGNIYCSVAPGDIYKRTAGAGNFVGLGETSRDWRGMAATSDFTLYAVVYDGDIYSQAPTAFSGTLAETAAASDVVHRDLFTPASMSEAISATDGVSSGDELDGDISDSATPADSTLADHARGGLATESATVSDIVSGAIERASAAGNASIDFIVVDGEGLPGFVALNSIFIPQPSVAATGLFGDISSGGVLYSGAVIGESDGLWGGLSDEANLIAVVSATGGGAYGGLGLGAANAAISVAYLAANPTGFISSGGILPAYIEVLGSVIGGDYAGDGVIYVPVGIYGGGVNTTGLWHGDVTWVVFPLNVPLSAVSRYSTGYSAYAVAGNKSYAIVDGVIRRIGERTDSGSAIASIIAKSGIDGGSGHRKIATDIFMRLMSEGNFTVNVSSDRGSGQITIADNLARKHGSKGDLPKGVIGREFAFNVKNVNGAYFEIDEIELIMALSEGRRGRQTNG